MDSINRINIFITSEHHTVINCFYSCYTALPHSFAAIRNSHSKISLISLFQSIFKNRKEMILGLLRKSFRKQNKTKNKSQAVKYKAYQWNIFSNIAAMEK